MEGRLTFPTSAWNLAPSLRRKATGYRLTGPIRLGRREWQFTSQDVARA